MKNIGIFIILFLSTTLVRAHQPDISTIMIVQKDDGHWILQMRASLTAFQQEVRNHYAATPYKTPEEFSSMVIDHVQSNVIITTSGEKMVTLKEGKVKLGHETSVYFQIDGLNSDFKELSVINTSFSDILRSQSALILLKKDFDKKQIMLNKSNDYAVTVITSDNRFEEFQHITKIGGRQTLYIITSVMGVLVILLLIFAYYRITSPKNTTKLAI